jgi:hypothetical protein
MNLLIFYKLLKKLQLICRNYGSKFFVLGYNSTYFSNQIQKSKTCYSEEQVISMMEFLIDSIFVSFVNLKVLASCIFLSLTSFWRNSDSYEYENKSARRGAQFVPIDMRTHHIWTYTSHLTTVVNSVLQFVINGTTSNFKS